MESIPPKEKAPEIVIEKASGEDAEAILNVFYKAWLATYPNEEAGITLDDVEDSYKDSFTPDTIEKTKRAYENVSPNEYRIAAKIDGKVVGISRVIKQEDRNKLQTLYVLPEYQGKGVGSSLWKAGKEFLDPSKDTYLEVVDYNENAINFYKKLGFEDTGKRMTDERFRMKSGSIFTEMEMRRPADLPIKAEI